MADCNHDCGSCSASCGERQDPASFKKPAHKESHIKKVIGVVSGKGGVGKSMVTSLLAMALRRAGKQVAILDADVTGPSIPKTFGLHGQALMTDRGVFPMETRMGITCCCRMKPTPWYGGAPLSPELSSSSGPM